MTDDQIIQLLLKDLDKIETELLRRLDLIIKSGKLTNVDIAQLAGEMDLFKELQALGYVSKLEKYFQKYEEIIKKINDEAISRGFKGIIGLAANDLDNFVNLQAQDLLGKGRQFAAELKSGLISNLIAGTPVNDVAQILKDSIPKLTGNQLKVALNEGIAQFRILTTAKVYENEPDVRFILWCNETMSADVDDKNRPSCRGVLTYQPKEGYTKKEIDEGAWTRLAIQGAHEFSLNAEGETIPSSYHSMDGKEYGFLNRGGFSCRHEPLAVI